MDLLTGHKTVKGRAGARPLTVGWQRVGGSLAVSMGIDMSMGYRPRQNSGVPAAGYSKAKLTLLALATADSALARPRKNGVTNQLGWLPRVQPRIAMLLWN